ncbi:ABC transporter ATP-binding protein [Aquincola sp. MAHUQ-54]|uniref:ABC transporter ATP-binding protein n=1 Tax=Aquincola agrisoli TaxID=3119538 RepID=A0AAW9Q779_9BURK
MADDALVIDVQGLTKRYRGRAVVDGLSMQVRRGEVFGFLGPNGSGKTTSIRMMCGLLTPDAGAGQTLGFDVVRESAAIKRRVGYMTQRFGLYEDLSIRENLDFIARVYGLDRRAARVDEALQRLGLATRAAQLAGSLSGGWKQRLALAGCMIHEPQLLLLDEPTAGVDPGARRAFWAEIHELASRGITVLVSTHYMDEAERCHRLGYIAYGRLLALGTPEALLADSGLVARVLEGPGAAQAAAALSAVPAVETATRLGDQWRLSGVDARALDEALAPWRGRDGLAWHTASPSLEELFIHLSRRSADNMA